MTWLRRSVRRSWSPRSAAAASEGNTKGYLTRGILLLLASSAIPTETALARQVAADPEAAVAPAPVIAEKPEFEISGFVVSYDQENPGLPSIDELMESARLTLTPVPGGFVVASPDGESRVYSLAELNEALATTPVPKLSRAALKSVTDALSAAIRNKGFLGVLAAIDESDLQVKRAPGTTDITAPENEWIDNRPADETKMRAKVYAARVVRVRSVGAGVRLPPEQRVDSPKHRRIRENSPVQAAGEGVEPGSDNLRRDLIDAYVLRLNRHPGRRVDVAISLADQPSTVVLDYLVRENKPWLVYFQLSNDGTRQTEEIRERFGFVHNQLLGRDDQLIIDYITSGFSDTYAIVGSYEFPLFTDRLRFKPYGSYNTFDASNVGQAGERFDGETWSVGGDVYFNIYQRRELFIDLVGSVHSDTVKVNNKIVPDLRGEETFFLIGGGARLQKFTDKASTSGSVRAEWNLPDIAATADGFELAKLGRLDPDNDFMIIHWGFEQSLFLEPIFDRKDFLAAKSVLANELVVRVNGQYTPDDKRLVPSYEMTAGGMDSVRGYPESVVAGDTVIVGSVEYRLHIPRLFEPYDELGTTPPMVLGKPFRVRPQSRYSPPDWDLILKAFFDFGQTWNNDIQPTEEDQSLMSAGVGFEIAVGRHISFRGDAGWVLDEVRGSTHVTEGASRFHFLLTLLY